MTRRTIRRTVHYSPGHSAWIAVLGTPSFYAITKFPSKPTKGTLRRAWQTMHAGLRAYRPPMWKLC